jgi:hypothetical protein
MEMHVAHMQLDGPMRPIPQLSVQLYMHLFVLHTMEIHVSDMSIGFKLPIAMDFMYKVYIHLEHVIIDIAHNK